MTTDRHFLNAISGLNCFDSDVNGMEFDGQDIKESFIVTNEEKFSDPYIFRRNFYRRWRNSTEDRRGECFGSIYHKVPPDPPDMTNVIGEFNKDDEALFLGIELENKAFTTACVETIIESKRHFSPAPKLILAKTADGRHVLPLLPKH